MKTEISRSCPLSPGSLKLIETEDGWTLPVAGHQVTSCCIDYAAVGLLVDNGVYITIEGVFKILDMGGGAELLDPEGDALNLAPVLKFRRIYVTGGTAFKDGSLELKFEDESRIVVKSDSRYEAWNIGGPGGIDGLKIVSTPGGELSIWFDRRE